jgi:hypothetical protein
MTSIWEWNQIIKKDFKIGNYFINERKRKEFLVPWTGKKCNWSAITIPGFAVYDQDNIGGYGGASGSVTTFLTVMKGARNAQRSTLKHPTK